MLNHSAESCLFPIRGEGLHTIVQGSEKAIEYYERLLTDWRPGDMESIWLLNVAYMTLGKHPDEVPEQWLIPAELFEETHNFPRFRDIAPFVGLADEMALSGGSVTEDFTNNGFIDIMASSWGLSDQLHYYENTGDGRFIKKTNEAGLTGITGGLNLIHADYNNDGWVDLFIGNESTPEDPHPPELYLNNQDGTFTNATAAAGIDVNAFIKGVAAGDVNNNGFQDLYISSSGRT